MWKKSEKRLILSLLVFWQYIPATPAIINTIDVSWAIRIGLNISESVRNPSTNTLTMP